MFVLAQMCSGNLTPQLQDLTITNLYNLSRISAKLQCRMKLTVYANYTMLMQPKYSPVVEKVPIQSSQLEFNLSLFKFEAETSPSKIMIQFCGLFLPQLSPQIMLFLSYSNSVIP